MPTARNGSARVHQHYESRADVILRPQITPLGQQDTLRARRTVERLAARLAPTAVEAVTREVLAVLGIDEQPSAPMDRRTPTSTDAWDGPG